MRTMELPEAALPTTEPLVEGCERLLALLVAHIRRTEAVGFGMDVVGVDVGATVATPPPPQDVDPQERSSELEMNIVDPEHERRTWLQEPVVVTSWKASPERADPIGLPTK